MAREAALREVLVARTTRSPWVLRDRAPGVCFLQSQKGFSAMPDPQITMPSAVADETVEDKVKRIIIDELGVDEVEVTPNARFIDELGADLLDQVELVMRFEEEFDLQIPDDDAERIQTVQAAVDYITKATQK